MWAKEIQKIKEGLAHTFYFITADVPLSVQKGGWSRRGMISTGISRTVKRMFAKTVELTSYQKMMSRVLFCATDARKKKEHRQTWL